MIDDAESGAHMSPLELSSSDEARAKQYAAVARRIRLLLDGAPRDWVAAMATVACELHGAFAYYDWTGFYRHTTPQSLTIGPYQGSHGCLSISFSRGVCGAAATQRKTQLVEDVNAFPGHIACASSTLSEVVVPILRRGADGEEEVVGVLDVDSNAPAAFRRVDQDCLEALMQELMQGQWTYCP
ncbi:hypothetical protein H632_c876p0 [Helicosporidium sp. ATCC 50920]|nr:hypothetical protein H632_c876p0 [Helicosporidium sp. ATCC 50920]|eukprot:KDD75092.1 hypothetical protein H632_c876p0 [Helicosporidium sp. ATCC 50920]